MGCLILVLCLTMLTLAKFLSLTDFLHTAACKLMHMDALKHYKISHIFGKLIRKTITRFFFYSIPGELVIAFCFLVNGTY